MTTSPQCQVAISSQSKKAMCTVVSMKHGLRKRQAKRGGMCGCGESLTRISGYSSVSRALVLGARGREGRTHYPDHSPSGRFVFTSYFCAMVALCLPAWGYCRK